MYLESAIYVTAPRLHKKVKLADCSEVIFGNHQHHDLFTYQSCRADAATHCSGHSRSPAAAL